MTTIETKPGELTATLSEIRGRYEDIAHGPAFVDDIRASADDVPRLLETLKAETCRAERAEAKLAAIVTHCRSKADEFNATMPLSVRPEDIKVMGGDILAIVNREEP